MSQEHSGISERCTCDAFVRPKKAAHMAERSRRIGENQDALTPLTARAWPRAVILPQKHAPTGRRPAGLGGVVDAGGNFLKETDDGPLFGGFYTTEATEYRDQRVAYLGPFLHHWGEFLLTSTVRLWHALENDRTIDRYVFAAKAGGTQKLGGNFAAFLQLFGIADKVDLVHAPTAYREVVVPKVSFLRGRYCHPLFKKVFDRIRENALTGAAGSSVPASAGVFLSRSRCDKARRKESGLDLLDHYFARNGFAIVHPETISLKELIRLLDGAEVLASESGTVACCLPYRCKKTVAAGDAVTLKIRWRETK